MENNLLCHSLAIFNLTIGTFTQLVVRLILLSGRVNQGQGLYQSSRRHFKALKRHAPKNTRQCVGKYNIAPSGVLHAKFERGQSQNPPAKPNYVSNCLGKPAQGDKLSQRSSNHLCST